jgi:hypothetical protein
MLDCDIRRFTSTYHTHYGELTLRAFRHDLDERMVYRDSFAYITEDLIIDPQTVFELFRLLIHWLRGHEVMRSQSYSVAIISMKMEIITSTATRHDPQLTPVRRQQWY